MTYVAYYRVSTARQGRSGLGLEAQSAAIRAFVGNAPLIGEYTEIESGRVIDRPELTKALAHARRTKSKLVIAKLDRLARSVAFVSSIMDSGVDFVCCDAPYANRLTLHILAAVAEDESRRISARVKEAIAAKRSRGEGWKGRLPPPATEEKKEAARIATRKYHQQKLWKTYGDLYATLKTLREANFRAKEIAFILNEQGHVSSTGHRFTRSIVFKLLKRFGIKYVPPRNRRKAAEKNS